MEFVNKLVSLLAYPIYFIGSQAAHFANEVGVIAIAVFLLAIFSGLSLLRPIFQIYNVFSFLGLLLPFGVWFLLIYFAGESAGFGNAVTEPLALITVMLVLSFVHYSFNKKHQLTPIYWLLHPGISGTVVAVLIRLFMPYVGK